jgi:para-aminobenzoate synthetase component II
MAPKILVIDNYDSFVYNLVQYLAELGAEVVVARNDETAAGDLPAMNLDGILISPGPGHPRSAGNCREIILFCYENRLPMLGVCLGHQALGEAFGGEVVLAPHLVHGKASAVSHLGIGVFAGAPSPLIAGRYHSLVVDLDSLPDCFEVTASYDGLIMGMRHRDAPLEGVQFHPESVMTQGGYLLLANWLAGCGSVEAVGRSAELNLRSDQMRRMLPVPDGAGTGGTSRELSTSSLGGVGATGW